MKAKITKRTVEAASPGSFLWDTELSGFGLKVNPSGKGVFIVQKRPHKGAKTVKRTTIGAYPAVSAEDARTEAEKVLGRITLGIPSSPVLSQSEGSFKDKIEDFYRDHVEAKLKPTTATDMRYMIDKHLIPEFGKLSLGEVDTHRVRSFHSTLGSKHPYRANRVLALLSKFFSSYQPGVANPCRGIEKFRERRRETSINARSLRRLLQADVHPAIRLLALTGMRKSEVLSLRWEAFSPRTRSLRLSDSKTGEKTIYLSDPALELLTSLPQRSTGWVFPGSRGSSGHLIGLQKIWKRTLKDLKLPSDLRLHDLRHHYASLAVHSVAVPLVGGLLGHRDIKTTSRYLHVDGGLARASELVGEEFSKLIKSG